MDTGPIAEHFDRKTCCGTKTPPGKLTSVSRALLRALEEVGVEGRSVLDLGCGTGNLALEILRRGATRTSGVDLSAESVEAANRRAADAGMQTRAAFRVGDAARSAHDRHDVVVLDKVICCYPDPDSLVAGSLGAAGLLFAYSAPESRGARGLVSRLAFFAENAWRRIRRDPFRTFVHDLSKVDARAEAAGFREVSAGRRFPWRIAIFARAPAS